MASFKNKFTDLADINNKHLTDDYVFNTLETLKIKGKTSKDGNFTFKGKTNWDDKAKGFSSSNEFKVDFPLCSKYFLWYGIRKGGEIKIHLDTGNTKIQNKDVNLFANVKSTNPQKTQFNVRLGANYWGEKCESNTRVELDTTNFQNIGLTHRNLIKHGKYLAGFVASLGLTDFKFTRTDAIIGHQCEKLDFYVSHVAGKENKGILGKAVIDAVYKHNGNHSFALQASNDFTNDTLSVALGHTSKLNDNLTFKHRLDKDLKFATALKYKFNNLFTVVASAELNFKAKSLFDTEKVLPIPLGFQCEFAI